MISNDVDVQIVHDSYTSMRRCCAVRQCSLATAQFPIVQAGCKAGPLQTPGEL